MELYNHIIPINGQLGLQPPLSGVTTLLITGRGPPYMPDSWGARPDFRSNPKLSSSSKLNIWNSRNETLDITKPSGKPGPSIFCRKMASPKLQNLSTFFQLGDKKNPWKPFCHSPIFRRGTLWIWWSTQLTYLFAAQLGYRTQRLLQHIPTCIPCKV